MSFITLLLPVKERQNTSSIIGTIMEAPARRMAIRPMVPVACHWNEKGLHGGPSWLWGDSGLVRRFKLVVSWTGGINVYW